ncbi:MAG: potassium transporter TrkG [Kiritimatiellia bacterium]
MTDQDVRRERLRDLEDDAVTVSQLASAPKNRQLNPRRLLALTFLLLIFAGTFLLMIPQAQASGHWAWMTPDQPFDLSFAIRQIIDNLFMATSASCVTGLAVVDVPSYYTFLGQLVLLLCIQIGGIGIITLGTFLMTLLLGRMSAENETQVMLSYGAVSASKTRLLLWRTMLYVFTFEAIGALLLFIRYYWSHGYTFIQSLWFSLFHSISAFCNAGISLHTNNLIDIGNDWFYMLVIALLVTLGGIGFLVLTNLSQYHFWKRNLRQRGRITLHSRLVLWSTLALCGGGGLLFLAFEWNASLGANTGASLWDCLAAGQWQAAQETAHLYWVKFCEGISQTAMYRTAGFTFVPMDEISQPSNFVSILLMLIGGSPGSVAGGMKTTTIIVLFLTMRAMIRGNTDIQIHRRTISNAISREAMVIVFFYLLLVFAFYFILLFTERALIAGRGDFSLFYEVTSAFGTVGMSLNATTLLTPFGRVFISLAMFLGRIGPISIAFMMAGHEITQRVRYPEENITVG